MNTKQPMTNWDNISPSVKAKVKDPSTWTKEDINRVFYCRKCGNPPQYCEETKIYQPISQCLVVYCKKGCPQRSRYACLNCKESLTSQWFDKHLTTPKHLENVDHPHIDAEQQYNKRPAGLPERFLNDSNDYFENNSDSFATPGEESVEVLEVSDKNTTTRVRHRIDKKFQWMVNAFRLTAPAVPNDLVSVFPGQKNMLDFWTAELVCPKSGGLRYLVARAFQKSKILNATKMPSLEEAQWHMKNCIQYQSMTDKQRRRHAMLLNSLSMSDCPTGIGMVFQNTYMPSYNDMNRIYGRPGTNSIWNILPIPTVQNIRGVAYVNPVDAVRFAFAFGVTVDDFYVDFNGPNPNRNIIERDNQARKTRVIFHICESRVGMDMKEKAFEMSPELQHQLKSMLLCWACDWRDGFGPAHTKNNRASVLLWTFTVAPPKDKINTTDNTFPIGLGNKKNAAFVDAEVQFFEDLKALSDPDNPLMVYSGTLQKIVPVYVKQIASLADKPERAAATYTLAYNSNYHRCFGKSVMLVPPLYDTEDVQNLVSSTPAANKMDYGWSQQFIKRTVNGGRLQACLSCRDRTLSALGRHVDATYYQDSTQLPGTCQVCCNWDIIPGSTMLKFPVSKEYPKTVAINCPVPPPPGREVSENHKELLPIKVTFELLIQAAKFAFFNCSQKSVRKQKTNWTKKECHEYLRTCGIGPKVQDEIYEAAVLLRQGGGPIVDFNSSKSLGDFYFPAPWFGHLTIDDYIEMLMHEIFLGLAKTNRELLDQYLDQSKYGVATWYKTVSPLLTDLKILNLSWLPTHPFSGEDSKGTGGWVSENWMAWVRLSKCCYSWFTRGQLDLTLNSKDGNGSHDVARMVIVFAALVARLLTHSGITENSTNSAAEVELYLKEFLSSIAELDVRVRHKQMSKKKQPNPNNETVQQEGTVTQGNQGTGNTTKKKKKKREDNEAFWMRSNYVSLINLPHMIRRLGPLVNMWDGGGKGEKFVQVVKPHIPRGIQTYQTFFPNIMEKLYKLLCLDFFEADGYLPNTEAEEWDWDWDAAVDDELNMASDDELNMASGLGGPDDEWNCAVEEMGMQKTRTIHIYQNQPKMEHAIENNELFSGILVAQQDNSALTMCHVLYTVYRKPQKSFGWKKIIFLDEAGLDFFGLWYAPIAVEDPVDPWNEPPQKVEDIKAVAKMAIVAIPLWYIVGKNKEHSNKYCVLTNWWKERQKNGQYRLPGLDFSLYKTTNSTDDDSTDSCDTGNVI